MEVSHPKSGPSLAVQSYIFGHQLFPILTYHCFRPCFLGNGEMQVLLSYGEKRDLDFCGAGSGLSSL